MSFVLAKGRARLEWYPKVASTAFTNGALVYADGSGAIQPADSTSGDHIGVIQKTIASTDSDYADTTMVPVLVPADDTEWDATVASGTALTTAMVGNRYDLSDSLELNVGATAKQVVTVTKFISATKARVKINAMIAVANVATT